MVSTGLFLVEIVNNKFGTGSFVVVEVVVQYCKLSSE